MRKFWFGIICLAFFCSPVSAKNRAIIRNGILDLYRDLIANISAELLVAENFLRATLYYLILFLSFKKRYLIQKKEREQVSRSFLPDMGHEL